MTHCTINKDTRIVTAVNLTREEAVSRLPNELFLLQADYAVVPQVGHILSTDNTELLIPTSEELRSIRNNLLQETDWRALPDYAGTNQQAWIVYRQELRDLPENYTLGSWLIPPNN